MLGSRARQRCNLAEQRIRIELLKHRAVEQSRSFEEIQRLKKPISR